jgi:hypothetical protein
VRTIGEDDRELGSAEVKRKLGISRAKSGVCLGVIDLRNGPGGRRVHCRWPSRARETMEGRAWEKVHSPNYITSMAPDERQGAPPFKRRRRGFLRLRFLSSTAEARVYLSLSLSLSLSLQSAHPPPLGICISRRRAHARAIIPIGLSILTFH